MADITRQNNVIRVSGSLLDQDLRFLLSLIYQVIEKSGYSDLTLDFSKCESAFASTMLAVCSQATAYREANIDFELIAPLHARLRGLFQNCNWAYLIDPRHYSPSTFRGFTHVPATHYQSPSEQFQAVNRIVNAMLGAVTEMARSDFGAFEWSINEIMDNVLTHSQSRTGGLVQVSTFQQKRRVIQFIVADAGLGIPETLREGHPEITSDPDALDRAVREGVTRDRSVGQGNGLFGTYQICSNCHGRFYLDSGHASLKYYDDTLHVSPSQIPYSGTLVVAEIDFSDPGLLGAALRFGGKQSRPTDIVELNYELEHSDRMKFLLKDEADSFGSRPAGTPVRNKLTNLLGMGATKIYVDMRDIPIVSSSFADEVFGKLFLELGPIKFGQEIEMVNAEPTVAHLVDRAIMQRIADSGN